MCDHSCLICSVIDRTEAPREECIDCVPQTFDSCYPCFLRSPMRSEKWAKLPDYFRSKPFDYQLERLPCMNGILRLLECFLAI